MLNLGDPNSALFTASERAALRYAEDVTLNSHQVSDERFQTLRQYFSEAGILEITAVVGLFNYFNRFNNALRVEITK